MAERRRHAWDNAPIYGGFLFLSGIATKYTVSLIWPTHDSQHLSPPNTTILSNATAIIADAVLEASPTATECYCPPISDLPATTTVAALTSGPWTVPPSVSIYLSDYAVESLNARMEPLTPWLPLLTMVLSIIGMNWAPLLGLVRGTRAFTRVDLAILLAYSVAALLRVCCPEFKSEEWFLELALGMIEYFIRPRNAPLRQVAAERQQLAADRTQLARDREQLVAERYQWTSERDQLAAEKDQLITEKDQLTAEREQLVRDHESALENLRAENAALKGELESSRNAAGEKDSQIREHGVRSKAALSERSRLEKDLKAINKKLKQMEEDKSRMLNSHRAALNDLSSTIESLTNDLKATKKSADEKDALARKHQQTAKQLESTVSELEAAQESLTEKDAEQEETMRRLESAASELEDAKQAIVEKESLVQKHEGVVKRLESEKAKLQKRNQEVSKELKEAEEAKLAQLAKHTSALEAAHSEKKRITAELSRLQGNKSSAEQRTEALQGSLSEAQQEKTVLTEQVSSLKGKLNSEKGKYEALETKYTNLEDVHFQMLPKGRWAEDEYDDTANADRIKELEDANQRLQKTIIEKEERLNATKRAAEKETKNLKAVHNGERMELIKLLEQTRAQKKTADKELDEIKHKIVVEATKGKPKQANNNLASLEQEKVKLIQDHAVEIEACNFQKKKLQEQLDEAEGAVKRLQREARERETKEAAAKGQTINTRGNPYEAGAKSKPNRAIVPRTLLPSDAAVSTVSKASTPPAASTTSLVKDPSPSSTITALTALFERSFSHAGPIAKNQVFSKEKAQEEDSTRTEHSQKPVDSAPLVKLPTPSSIHKQGQLEDVGPNSTTKHKADAQPYKAPQKQESQGFSKTGRIDSPALTSKWAADKGTKEKAYIIASPPASTVEQTPTPALRQPRADSPFVGPGSGLFQRATRRNAAPTSQTRPPAPPEMLGNYQVTRPASGAGSASSSNPTPPTGVIPSTPRGPSRRGPLEDRGSGIQLNPTAASFPPPSTPEPGPVTFGPGLGNSGNSRQTPQSGAKRGGLGGASKFSK